MDLPEIERRLVSLEKAFFAHLHVARLDVESSMQFQQAGQELKDWMAEHIEREARCAPKG